MTTILEIAMEDATALADASVAMRAKITDRDDVLEYFTRRTFRSLYRAHILRTRGRNPSNRECDIALREAMADGQD